MKNIQSKIILLAALAGSLVTPAWAQVQLVFTGSTAFRAIDLDRIQSLFDTTGFSTVALPGNNFVTDSGTMSKVFGAGGPNVVCKCSFSGSIGGLVSLANETPVPCIPVGGSTDNENDQPDIAFSDAFPSAAAIPDSTFATNATLGVIPFVFAKANSAQLAGVTSITREQAVLLETDGGSLPASFLGGTMADPDGTNVIYFIGRNSDSGTRVSVNADVGFIGIPNLFENVGGVWKSTADGFVGFSSGSGVAGTLQTNVNVIGYLGLNDFNSIKNNAASALNYEGVPYSSNNVVNGSYAIWGYEHMAARYGLSPNQEAIRQALVAAITDPNYQHTNGTYTVQFLSLPDMQVQRATDGGPITGKNF